MADSDKIAHLRKLLAEFSARAANARSEQDKADDRNDPDESAAWRKIASNWLALSIEAQRMIIEERGLENDW